MTVCVLCGNPWKLRLAHVVKVAKEGSQLNVLINCPGCGGAQTVHYLPRVSCG